MRDYGAGRSVVRIYACPRSRSDGAQIVCRGLTGLSISNNLERDFLSVTEALQASAFDRADMHKNVLTTAIWLDESEAFLAIEPLHGSLRHLLFLQLRFNEAVRQQLGRGTEHI